MIVSSGDGIGDGFYYGNSVGFSKKNLCGYGGNAVNLIGFGVLDLVADSSFHKSRFILMFSSMMAMTLVVAYCFILIFYWMGLVV